MWCDKCGAKKLDHITGDIHAMNRGKECGGRWTTDKDAYLKNKGSGTVQSGTSPPTTSLRPVKDVLVASRGGTPSSSGPRQQAPLRPGTGGTGSSVTSGTGKPPTSNVTSPITTGSSKSPPPPSRVAPTRPETGGTGSGTTSPPPPITTSSSPPPTTSGGTAPTLSLEAAKKSAAALSQRIDKMTTLAGDAPQAATFKQTLADLKKRLTDAQRLTDPAAIVTTVTDVSKAIPPFPLAVSANSIKTKSESELKALPITDQIALLSGVAAEVKRRKLAGESPDVAQSYCDKLYHQMPMDDKFKREDLAQRKKYLTALQTDPKLIEASNEETWKTLTTEDQINRMQGALTNQYATLLEGVTAAPPYDAAPQIEKKRWTADGTEEQIRENEAAGTSPQGYYTKHKIILWIHEKGPLRNFEEAFDTAIHETTHAYQNALVDQLDKTILPGDWRYEQVQLFKLNNDAYNGGSDQVAYRNEPLEIHAWLAGNTAALLFNWDAKMMDLGAKLKKAIGHYPDESSKLVAAFRKVKEAGTDLTARGDAYVVVNNAADAMIKKAAKEKERLQTAFNNEHEAVKRLTTEVGRISAYTDTAPQIRRTELFEEYAQILKRWNEGPIAELADCTSSLVTLQTNLTSVKSALNEFETSNTLSVEINNNLGTLNGLKVPQKHYQEYSGAFDLFKSYKQERDTAGADPTKLRTANGKLRTLRDSTTRLIQTIRAGR